MRHLTEDHPIPIETLLTEALLTYKQTNPQLPIRFKKTSLTKKIWNERQLQKILSRVIKDLEPYEAVLKEKTTVTVQEAEEISSILIHYLQEINERQLLSSTPLLDFFIEHDFIDSLKQLFLQAKEKDTDLSHNDLIQALRHIWVMNFLQLYFDQPIQLTSTVYAFGLLYPYEDNFLDNPAISLEEKSKFNTLLSSRLKGERVQPTNVLETKISEFLHLVDTQFKEKERHKIYESIAYVHEAQIKSMKQSSTEALTEDEILSITFLKGGSVVLADALLIKENLNLEDLQFVFQIGTYLQLIDDLQDIKEDAGEGTQTIFNIKKHPVDVDREIKKFLSYVSKGNEKQDFDTTIQVTEKNSLNECMVFLTMDAVGRNPDTVSKKMYKELESFSNVRLSFYKKLWKELENVLGF